MAHWVRVRHLTSHISRSFLNFPTASPSIMSSPNKQNRPPWWGDGPRPTREEMQRREDETSGKCLEFVKENAQRGSPKSVLETIELFCKTHHMMNVGPVKGAIIDEEIRKKQPAVMVELGGFTGYSAVRFANVQREVAGGKPSHYYSFEFSSVYAARIREMVEIAGLTEQVTVFEGPFSDRYHELDGKTVDVYFIDHEKSVYLSDLKLILGSGTLAPGSVIVADNVVMPGAPDYLEFIENSPQFTTIRHTVRHGFRNELMPDVSVATFLGHSDL